MVETMKPLFFVLAFLAVFSLGGMIHPSKVVLQHLSKHGGPGVGHKIIQYKGIDYAVSWVRHGKFTPSELKTTDIPAEKLRQIIETGCP